jgi:hypothetical protein
MGKILRVLALLALLPALLFAGGETGGDVLLERTGVRAIGMGGAYTAAGDDVESINYNPAGIAFVTRKEIEFLYPASEFAGLSVIYGAFAQPFEAYWFDGFMGISGIFRNIAPIDHPDANSDDPPVTYYDAAITATYATSLWQFLKSDIYKNINMGISVKAIIEQIGPHTGNTFALDLGMLYAEEGAPLKLGVSILNVGFPMKEVRGGGASTDPAFAGAPLPMTLRAGAAYKAVIDKNNTTQFALDYIQDFYDFGQFAFGIEHNLINILFMRLGYDMSIDTRNPSIFSGGIGILVTTSVPVPVTAGVNYTYRLQMWDWPNTTDALNYFSVILKF